MSTLLQLVNKLAVESRISGAPTTLTTTIGATGDSLRFVNWVIDAHREIQNRYTMWRWLRSTFSVNTQVGVDTYAPSACTDTRLAANLTRFGHWITQDESGAANVMRYLTAGGVSGQQWMQYLPWSYFRALYRRGTQNNGPILHFTVDPQNNLIVGPKPDDIYTVSGEYQMASFDLAIDTDTPEFPARFHDVVMWYALDKYGRTTASQEVVYRAEMQSKRLLRQLEADQLPMITLGAPLA